MLYLFGAYLAAAGGASAGAQVARGAVRGAAKLFRGDVRGALAEAAGGLAAPVVTAVAQFSGLAADVCKSVKSLTAEVREKAEAGRAGPAAATARPRRGRQRGRLNGGYLLRKEIIIPPAGVATPCRSFLSLRSSRAPDFRPGEIDYAPQPLVVPPRQRNRWPQAPQWNFGVSMAAARAAPA